MDKVTAQPTTTNIRQTIKNISWYFDYQGSIKYGLESFSHDLNIAFKNNFKHSSRLNRLGDKIENKFGEKHLFTRIIDKVIQY